MAVQEQTPDETAAQVTAAGRRRINLIWENTQAAVALIVVMANIIYAMATFFAEPNQHAEALMANAFFLVIGFYFGRTNHARLGDRATP